MSVRRFEQYAYTHRMKLAAAAGLCLVSYLVCTGHENLGAATGVIQLLWHVLDAREGGPDAGSQT
jgi:hypothetical protein